MFNTKYKEENYVSELRSTLKLFEKSTITTHREYREAKRQCIDNLARKNLIYPKCFSDRGLTLGMPYQDRKELLGLYDHYQMSPEEKRFQQFLETEQRKMRKANWEFRIGSHAEYMRDKEWFGFFVTLTVCPTRCRREGYQTSKDMWKHGKVFSRYIRRVADISAKACGHPSAISRGASAKDYVHYAGVIEHGKSGDHHHMHLILWMRGIPSEWKRCPNRNIVRQEHRTKQTCWGLSTQWPLSLPGIGVASYFRHEGDQWSKLGFATPMAKNGQPMRINPAEKAGLYIAKYMEKEDKRWEHRIKATRGLGLDRLKQVLLKLHLSHLEALTHRIRNYSLNVSVQTTLSVPQGILRYVAKQIVFSIKWDLGLHNWESVLQENCDAYPRMLRSVKDGAEPHKMHSKAYYDWVTKHLPEPKGYCEHQIAEAYLQLIDHFPVINSKPINKIGGMAA